MEKVTSLLNGVYQAIAELKQIEPAYKVAQQQVHTAVEQVSQAISDDQDWLEEVVAHLYWFETDVPMDSIVKAFNIKEEQVKKIAKNVHPNIRCQQCNDLLIRPDLPHARRSLICKSCEIINRTSTSFEERKARLAKAKTTKAIRDEKYRELQADRALMPIREKQARETKKLRLVELRAMPYRDYLLTPEWQKKRHSALRRADGRCQVCNASNRQLDVHHRSYERLGEERYTDIIVLCHSCHGTFHKNGKLATK